MVSRLYAILDPQVSSHTVKGRGKGRGKQQQPGRGRGGSSSSSKEEIRVLAKSKSGGSSSSQQEAEYLERRNYRARLLQGVRAAREAELRKGNKALRQRREAEGARVPGREELQQVRASQRVSSQCT